MMSADKGKALQVWQGTLGRYSDHFQEAIPVTVKRFLTPERMIRTVLNAMWKLPQLQQCTIPSVIMSVMDFAQLGLELAGPLGQGYMVPFRNRKAGVVEATTIVGYRGYITLATRSDEIAGPPWANVVREADVASGRFELDAGSGKPPRHVVDPMLTEGDRGRVVGAYSVIPFGGGVHKVEWMSIDQLDGIRSRSRAKNNGPWVTDTVEMYRKTALRRLLKTCPMNSEVGRAMFVDQAAETNEARNALLEYGQNFAASVMSEPDSLDQTPDWSEDRMEKLASSVKTPKGEWDDVGPPPMDVESDG
jgi:recombination protein RecT